MKFTDAVVVTLKEYFETGDQPTQAQFAALIDRIQEGIEEHQHDSTGDGDGTGILNGPITMADDSWIGIGAAQERIIFDAIGDICVVGANFGVGTLAPLGIIHAEQTSAGANISLFIVNPSSVNGTRCSFTFQQEDLGANQINTFFQSRLTDNTDGLAGTEIRLYNTQSGALVQALTIDKTGKTGFMQPTPIGRVHAKVADAIAMPPLVLEQLDLSEEMFELVTTVGVGNPVEAVGIKTLTPTGFIRITIPGGLARYIQFGTIA
jgi:hypothetical protein